MRIILTGGGTGGHFYPIIAVAQALRKQISDRKLIDPELYFLAPDPYDEKALYENGLVYKKVTAGKRRRYFSILNFFDLFKTLWGTVRAVWTVFRIYPDVVFSKGGYASFPVVVAAKILRIPIVIHESDSVPGRANMWAGKFAERIALSYPEAAGFFPKEKTALTGNPVRHELLFPVHEGAKEFFSLEADTPVVLVLGGSQGSQLINENIIDALPSLLEKYQVIHQTGKNNFKIVNETVNVVLEGNKFRYRYKPYPHLDILAMRMAAGAADIIISRAGSTIFEIANWGKPSLLVPITDTNGDHQRKNAYNYARTGAAEVLEENNISAHIIISEVDRILSNSNIRQTMAEATKEFAKENAAELIADEILEISLKHIKA